MDKITITTNEQAVRKMILDGKDDNEIISSYAISREDIAAMRKNISQEETFIPQDEILKGDFVNVELGEEVFISFKNEYPVIVSNEICNHTHYQEVNGTHVHCTHYKGHDGDHGCEFGEFSLRWTRG